MSNVGGGRCWKGVAMGSWEVGWLVCWEARWEEKDLVNEGGKGVEVAERGGGAGGRDILLVEWLLGWERWVN